MLYEVITTVGYATPEYISQITKDAIEATRLPVSLHCHNDFGLAVANALSGIRSGAQCAHVTINGIGERAGNASLEEFAMSLQCLQWDQKYETGIKSELIYETSRFVSKIVGIQVQPNKAIVGDNAFGHDRITSYNVCYTKLLRQRRYHPQLLCLAVLVSQQFLIQI